MSSQQTVPGPVEMTHAMEMMFARIRPLEEEERKKQQAPGVQLTQEMVNKFFNPCRWGVPFTGDKNDGIYALEFEFELEC